MRAALKSLSAVILAGALALTGAVAANADEAAPGSSFDNPIYVEPNTRIQNDRCGTANDNWTKVNGATGQLGQANFLTKENYTDPAARFVFYAQAGKVGGVYYAFEGVTPNQYGTYEIVTYFPAFTNVPCE